MWIIITIIVAGLIIWAIVSNNSDNEKIRDYNLNMGGLKYSYPNFVNLMEEEFSYSLKYDNGRNLCYEKLITTKNQKTVSVIVGIKLDLSNRAILYSTSLVDGITVKGIEIVSFNSNKQSIRDSIEKSIESLKLENNDNYIFDITTPEYWAQKAIESFQQGNIQSAKSFVEKAYIMEETNIEYAFLYCITLVDENKKLSLLQLQNNFNKLEELIKILNQRESIGLLNSQQTEKLKEISHLRVSFYEFIHDYEMRLDCKTNTLQDLFEQNITLKNSKNYPQKPKDENLIENDDNNINIVLKYCLDIITEIPRKSPSEISKNIENLELAMLSLNLKKDLGMFNSMQIQLLDQLELSKIEVLKYCSSILHTHENPLDL